MPRDNPAWAVAPWPTVRRVLGHLMRPPPPATGHLAQLDGLRAVAALMVFFSHSQIGSPSWGAMGVWLFFVLSGYLLFGPIARAEALRPRALAGYYTRRLFRILPPYVFVLIVYAYFFWDWRILLDHILFQYAYMHFWSIRAEMILYLVLPLFAAGYLAFSGLKSRLIGLMGLVAIAYWLTEILRPPWLLLKMDPDTTWMIFITPFLMGALVSRIDPMVSDRAAAWLGALGAGIAVLLCLDIEALHQIRMGLLGLERNVAGDNPLPLYLCATAIVLAAVRGRVSILGHPILEMFGRIAFGFYLWHILALLSAAHLGFDGVSQVLVAFPLTLIPAVATYYFIENPSRNLGRMLARRISGAQTSPAGITARQKTVDQR